LPSGFLAISLGTTLQGKTESLFPFIALIKNGIWIWGP